MGKINIAEEGAVPSTPSAGYGLIYPRGGSWYVMSDDGIEHTLVVGGGAVYGTNLTSQKNTPQQATTSTSPVLAASMPVNVLVAGDYRIDYYYEWRRQTTGNDFHARIDFAGVPVANHAVEAKDVNAWHPVSGFNFGTLPVGATTTEVYFWGESGANNSWIRNIMLSFYRIS